MLRIAYLVLAHTNPTQLGRLLKVLDDQNVVFVVHLDLRADLEMFKQTIAQCNLVATLHFTKKRFKCFRYDFSLVEATNELLGELFNQNIDFKYAILISGTHYPIKSNRHIQEYLVQNAGKEFLEHFSILSKNSPWKDMGLLRFANWYFRFGDMLYPKKILPNFIVKHLALRKFPRGFHPFGGSQWWCLSYDCVRYISKFVSENNKFVNFFRHTQAPDEIFYHTIVLNSHFSANVVNTNLCYIDWSIIREGSPKTLGITDYEKLAHCPLFFARKFDLNVDSKILDLVDDNLLSR